MSITCQGSEHLEFCELFELFQQWKVRNTVAVLKKMDENTTALQLNRSATAERNKKLGR